MSLFDPFPEKEWAFWFTPLEIMPRSVSSPAIAGLEFLTGFTGKIKYCIQEEPMGDYQIGAEIIETGDKIGFEVFLKVHDFIKERIGDIF